MSILSRFGIGSATIDLIPDQVEVEPGGQVEAHLEVSGGTSAQHVDDIEVAVVTRYRAQREDDSYPTHYVLWETEFKEGFTVEPRVEQSIDVPDIHVPPETPVTLGDTEVWIQTGLDIDWALDPSDEDQLEVRPPSLLATILDAMDDMGFDLEGVSNEEADVSAVDTPFLQRFQFVPDSSSPIDSEAVYLWPVGSGRGDGLEMRITRRELGAAQAPVVLSFGSDTGDDVVDAVRDALKRL